MSDFATAAQARLAAARDLDSALAALTVAVERYREAVSDTVAAGPRAAAERLSEGARQADAQVVSVVGMLAPHLVTRPCTAQGQAERDLALLVALGAVVN